MITIKNILVHQLWTLVYEEKTKIIHLKEYFEYNNLGTKHKVMFFDNEEEMNEKIKELNLITLNEYLKLNRYNV
jgi:hypothetical protein